jgi:hypothetical protein
MIYRVRTYEILPEKLEKFNEFFMEYLYPNQLKHGSRLVGRWVDLSRTKITAVWEYESVLQYENIEKRISRTKMHKEAKRRKNELGPLFITSNQEFWERTGDYLKKENEE